MLDFHVRFFYQFLSIKFIQLKIISKMLLAILNAKITLKKPNEVDLLKTGNFLNKY